MSDTSLSNICEMCGEQLITENRLHPRKCPMCCLCKDTRHACPECGKCFTTKWNMQAHQNTHTDRKPFQCGECGKSFVTKQSYQEHVLRHRKEKPIQCDYCGKRYYSRRELMKHLPYHTKPTDFPCSVCHMFFKDASSLSHHNAKLHPQVMSCVHCQETFKNTRALQRHLSERHQDLESKKSKTPRHLLANFRKVLCNLCGLILSNRYRLKKHLQIKHQILETEWQEGKYAVELESVEGVTDQVENTETSKSVADVDNDADSDSADELHYLDFENINTVVITVNEDSQDGSNKMYMTQDIDHRNTCTIDKVLDMENDNSNPMDIESQTLEEKQDGTMFYINNDKSCFASEEAAVQYMLESQSNLQPTTSIKGNDSEVNASDSFKDIMDKPSDDADNIQGSFSLAAYKEEFACGKLNKETVVGLDDHESCLSTSSTISENPVNDIYMSNQAAQTSKSAIGKEKCLPKTKNAECLHDMSGIDDSHSVTTNEVNTIENSISFYESKTKENNSLFSPVVQSAIHPETEKSVNSLPNLARLLKAANCTEAAIQLYPNFVEKGIATKMTSNPENVGYTAVNHITMNGIRNTSPDIPALLCSTDSLKPLHEPLNEGNSMNVDVVKYSTAGPSVSRDRQDAVADVLTMSERSYEALKAVLVNTPDGTVSDNTAVTLHLASKAHTNDMRSISVTTENDSSIDSNHPSTGVNVLDMFGNAGVGHGQRSECFILTKEATECEDKTTTLADILPRSDSHEEFLRFEQILKTRISRLRRFSEYECFLDRLIKSLQYSRFRHRQRRKAQLSKK